MCFLPITVSANTKYAPESVYSTIYNVFSVHGEVIAKKMALIAFCESSYNNLAINEKDTLINGSPSFGVFQISLMHGYDKDYLSIPYNNAIVALKLYRQANETFSPWKRCASTIS